MRPAVLVVHQWMGLTDYEKMRTDQLAELGYIAFAVDMFGTAKPLPTTKEEATAAITPFIEDRQMGRQRIAAALDFIKTQEGVDTSRIGAIGFCFGGAVVLELARSGAAINGVISFHGLLNTTLPAEKDAVKASVMVQHGALDPLVPPTQVADFMQEMMAANVQLHLTSHASTYHSFTQEAAQDAENGMLYNEKAMLLAFAEMEAFLAECFT